MVRIGLAVGIGFERADAAHVIAFALFRRHDSNLAPPLPHGPRRRSAEGGWK
jgi:hypothetical protein